MAETKTYRITEDDGTTRYLKLDEEDHKAWRKRADDKSSPIASITAAEPEPINAATGGTKRGAGS